MLRSHSLMLVAIQICVLSLSTCVRESEAQTATEIRWFFDQPLPSIVSSWFEAAGPLGPAISDAEHDKRSDVYLLVQDQSVVGLKIRGGNFEFKQKDSSRVASFLSGRAAGQAEVWRRWTWSYVDPGTDVVTNAFLSASNKRDRVQVGKDRRQRKFNAAARSPVPVTLDERIDVGCLAEVAGVTIFEKQFWTLAIESFGGDAHLQACAELVLAAYPGPTLDARLSLSYPSWLNATAY